ncbi:MAG: tetratricopeptide repeat protein [Pirellulales bacterium]
MDAFKGALHLGGDKQPKPAKSPDVGKDEISLATESGPPGPELYVSLARLYERKGNLEKAIELYRKAIDTQPNCLPAMLGYAHLQDRQGKLVEATELYQKAAKAYPKDAAVFNDLGLCLARRSMFRESVEALSRAVELQPEKKLYRNNIATVLVKTGRLEEAFSHLKLVHGEAIAYYNMGFLLDGKGDRQQAAYHYAKALEKDPSFTAAAEGLRRVAGGMSPESPRSTPGPALVRADAGSARPAATDGLAGPRSSVALVQPDATASRGMPPVARRAEPGDDRVALAPEPAPSPGDGREALRPDPRAAQPEREASLVIRLPRDADESASGTSAAIPPSPDALNGAPASNVAPEAVQPLPAVESSYYPPSRY